MRFRALFESEHEDMAHEILTGHGLVKGDHTNSFYKGYYGGEGERDEAHQSLIDTMRSVGWKHLPTNMGNYLAHPENPNTYIKLKKGADTQSRHTIGASFNREDPVIGGMHGTIKMVGENEVAVNAAGPGCVDGIGIGSKGEPGYPANKKKRGLTLRGVLSTRGLSDGDDK